MRRKMRRKTGRKIASGLAVLAVALLVLTDPASAHMGGAGSFSCRASAVRLSNPDPSKPPFNLGAEPWVANDPGTPCKTESSPYPLGLLVASPFLRATILTAKTTLNPGGVAGGKAESSVATVTITVGTATITAQALAATAQSGCAIENGMPLFAGSSSIVSLQVNGAPVANLNGPVTIPIPGVATVYVNRQLITNNSVITQRALEVYAPLLNLDIVVAEAVADVESCQPVLT